LLNAQLTSWSQRCGGLAEKRWLFVVPPSQARISSQMGGNVTVQTNWKGNYHLVYFPAVPMEIPKASEWSKMDVAQEIMLAGLLQANFDAKSRTTEHIHIYSHVFSAKVFELFAVHTLGSAHNMMGLMTTYKEFPFAMNEGPDPWKLEVKKSTALDKDVFLLRTMCHNAGRSSFFLNGKYHFNPCLNLIRHLPGKTVDYVTGIMEDVGIDISPGTLAKEFISQAREQEEDEFLSDSEDERESELKQEEVKPYAPTGFANVTAEINNRYLAGMASNSSSKMHREPRGKATDEEILEPEYLSVAIKDETF